MELYILTEKGNNLRVLSSLVSVKLGDLSLKLRVLRALCWILSIPLLEWKAYDGFQIH